MAATAQSAIAVIGIDVGKNSFHVVGLDARGAIALRQKWSAESCAYAVMAFRKSLAEAGYVEGQNVSPWNSNCIVPGVRLESRAFAAQATGRCNCRSSKRVLY